MRKTSKQQVTLGLTLGCLMAGAAVAHPASASVSENARLWLNENDAVHVAVNQDPRVSNEDQDADKDNAPSLKPGASRGETYEAAELQLALKDSAKGKEASEGAAPSGKSSAGWAGFTALHFLPPDPGGKLALAGTHLDSIGFTRTHDLATGLPDRGIGTPSVHEAAVVTPEPLSMMLYGLGGLPLAAHFIRRRRQIV